MSKAVLISIQPKWCEKIANGEKTVEVRKARPKLNTTFKCYIYCTKPKFPHEDHITLFNKQKCFYAGGFVIGEFVCDEIRDFKVLRNGDIQDYYYADLDYACLDALEIGKYIGSNQVGYSWGISDLGIYDTPKLLSEFTGLWETKFGFAPVPITRAPQSWRYVEELPKM